MKSPNHRNASDPTSWARRVNVRWIAHHGLNDDASAYLDHLGQSDPERLTRSCRRAQRLVRGCQPGEDPKPWFYAGLFSLATEPEVNRYLARHWFTRMAVGRGSDGEALSPAADQVGEGTHVKLNRIRQALDCLVDEGG